MDGLNISYEELVQKNDLDPQFVKQNQVLFSEGQEVDAIYYIEDGEVFISRDKLILWSARKNELVGISSFMSPETTYRFTAKACKNSILYKIPIYLFEEHLLNDSQFTNHVIRDFCRRIDGINLKTRYISSKSSRNRFIALLVDYVKNTGSTEVAYKLSDISSIIGVSTRRIKLMVKELEEKGMIQFVNNSLKVLDLKGLEIVGSNNYDFK